ncbi:RHS repeat-associated core domain-containing protein [Pseudomonas hunanensis]|uniref:RHS repeat-associated core domain-containing protein n=1 Tax=Pseudomonas TaxID=286 RepID=UPI001AE3F25A|nr:RHS repeat-associated protein [Pseudomonas sp. BP6]MBP2287190.1 RHS repeat-associated protein [Pseudomonas sp. BP7]HDS1696978.1 RHS repeat-associated core domain-containing protein [Pseudomonas putida]HDS1702097.1 RHS repeat-associated core domain-containing protein [Pseudomonas putida]
MTLMPAVVNGYSPYGYRTHRGACVLAFNGERRDPFTGCYHLGNGYRAYNPALMRFQAQDSFSPFGAGGLNGYAYCAGDPVNRVDPSGHSFDVGGLLLRGLGMLSNGATIAYNFLGPTPETWIGLNATRVSTFGSILSLGSSAALYAGVPSAIFGANVGTAISAAATLTRAINAAIGPGSRPLNQIKTNWNLMTGGLPEAPMPHEFVLEVVTPTGRPPVTPSNQNVVYDINERIRQRRIAGASPPSQALDIRRPRSQSK